MGVGVGGKSLWLPFSLAVNLKMLFKAAYCNLYEALAGPLSWLEHHPDRPRLRVQVPVWAHARSNQTMRPSVQ